MLWNEATGNAAGKNPSALSPLCGHHAQAWLVGHKGPVPFPGCRSALKGHLPSELPVG